MLAKHISDKMGSCSISCKQGHVFWHLDFGGVLNGGTGKEGGGAKEAGRAGEGYGAKENFLAGEVSMWPTTYALLWNCAVIK